MFYQMVAHMLEMTAPTDDESRRCLFLGGGGLLFNKKKYLKNASFLDVACDDKNK